MLDFLKKISVYTAIILLWIDIKNFTPVFLIQNAVFICGFSVCAILPYAIKKNPIIALAVSLAVTILITVYEKAYAVWAVPSLCLLYAHKFTIQSPKITIPKIRSGVIITALLGDLILLIAFAVNLRFYDALYYPPTSVQNSILAAVFLVLFVLSILSLNKKATTIEKQRKKLLSVVYISAAVCHIALGLFYKLIGHFLYCHDKFVFLPWIALLCFMINNNDPFIESSVSSIRRAFDKFSKTDLETK